MSCSGLLAPALTSEQTMLEEATERFIAENCPLEEVRRLIDAPTGTPADYFDKTAPLGWYGLLVPENLGGGAVSRSPLSDAVVVAKRRGASLQPGAFVPQNVVAFALGAEKPDSDLAMITQRLVEGRATASWAIGDSIGHRMPGGAVRAEARGPDHVLDGVAGLVQDADRVDWLLVAAPTAEGPRQFLVPTNAPGVVVTPLEALDVTKRFSSVRLDGVSVEGARVVGDPIDTAARIEAQLQRAVILQVAESVGAMDALFERTCAYSKDRIAFGRPIGSFQAIKHVLADLSLLLEGTHAALAGAIEAVEEASDDAPSIVSMLKAYAGDAGVEIAQGCLQIHGGIGFTWEHDLHLYLRRLTSDAALFGDPIWHRERLGSMHSGRGRAND